MQTKNLDIYKYCYDFWKQCNFDTSKLINIKNAVGIKNNDIAVKIIRKYAKNYATTVLGISEDDFYNKLENKKHKSEYFNTLEKLSDCDIEDKDSIFQILSYCDKSFLSNSKKIVNNYIKSYRINEINLKEDLINKIETYRQYIDYINYIVKSINSNDFDIIDYHLMTKNHFNSFEEFNYFCKDAVSKNFISKENYDLIKSFLRMNSRSLRDLKPISTEEIVTNKEIIDIKFDNKGNMIENSGKIITYEEKMDTIKFLKDNDIPVNIRTYKAAQKRIIGTKNKHKKK